MKEIIKTNKEDFEQKYPFKEVTHNPILCAEALGYLKALTLYLPSEQIWANSKMTDLMLILLFYSL